MTISTVQMTAYTVIILIVGFMIGGIIALSEIENIKLLKYIKLRLRHNTVIVPWDKYEKLRNEGYSHERIYDCDVYLKWYNSGDIVHIIPDSYRAYVKNVRLLNKNEKTETLRKIDELLCNGQENGNNESVE